MILLLLALTMTFVAIAQKAIYKNIDQLSESYAKQSFDELKTFFGLPNDAYFPADIELNMQWCEQAFQKRGFTTERLETSEIPLLLATRSHRKATKTVLIYLQIDGQPVDTSKWFQPDPYEATLKNGGADGKGEILSWAKLQGEINPGWRIFARSASDAKGPVMMFLKAMDIINDHHFNPDYNIKVIMDFEEEISSPRLPKAVIDYQRKLSADRLVIFDGPRHISNEPTLTYGARGIVTLSLEVFGPRAPQHSGHYGNYVPNPALRLSQLLSSMMHENGRVAIPGWYEGITISEEVRKTLQAVPDDEDEMRKKLGISAIDQVANNYQEAMQYPSLSILGLQSGWVGDQTRTIIPASATAEMNIRLVKETDAERMVSLVKSHILSQGYHLISGEPTEEERQEYSKIARFDYQIAYAAFRTELDSDTGIWLRSAMRKAFAKAPIEIRTGGGSIPISPFVNTLNIPAVIVPTVNKDNNQHSPNENIRLGNYLEGIKTITVILCEPIEKK